MRQHLDCVLTEMFKDREMATFLQAEGTYPSSCCDNDPVQGFRSFVVYGDVHSLIAAVSADIILDVFCECFAGLGKTLDVVARMSEKCAGPVRKSFPGIPRGPLRRVILRHKELLLNDGFIEVSVLSRDTGHEIILDEHKLLAAKAPCLEDVVSRLMPWGVFENENVHLVLDGLHIHSRDMHVHDPRRVDFFDDLIKLSI